MENLYWVTEGRGHHIDVNAIKLLCFDLLNLFEANRSLLEEFDAAAAEDETPRRATDDPLIALHVELADTQMRKHLLQLAMLTRTYDDVMRESPRSDLYEAHSSKTDGDGNIGWVDDKPLTLREACNKIIHAREIRPATDRLDRTVISGHENDPEEVLVYRTGLVELKGRLRRTEWEGAIMVPEFISTVIERITFGVGNDE
jgi:hypothetical protein